MGSRSVPPATIDLAGTKDKNIQMEDDQGFSCRTGMDIHGTLSLNSKKRRKRREKKVPLPNPDTAPDLDVDVDAD